MSDSFADLWSSSAHKPSQQQQTLSSISLSGSQRQNPSQASRNGTTNKPDVFSLLASSGTNGSSGGRYAAGGSGSTGAYGSGSTTNNGNLNRPGNSASSSRPITPAMSSLGGRSNSNTPAPVASSRSNNGDAFSDLFSSSGTSNGNGNASNMTLAARLAMEAKARQGSSPGPAMQSAQASGVAGGDAWAGLDSLASGAGGLELGLGISPVAVSAARTNRTAISGHVNININDEDDWGLGDFGSNAKSQVTTTRSQNVTPSAPPARTQSQSSSNLTNQNKPTSLWDLDDFASSPPQPARANSSSSSRNIEEKKPISRTGSFSSHQSGPPKAVDAFRDDTFNLASPDADFDFGNREDRDDYPASARSQGRNGVGRGLLDSDDEGDGFGRATHRNGHGRHSADEDDILGMLSQPVEAVKAKTGTQSNRHDDLSWQDDIPESRTTSTSSRGPPPAKTRSSSPPPHILGQIVEMGFSVQQAREALRATKDGQDVQAAIESLLNGSGSQGGGSTHRPSPPSPITSRGPPPGHGPPTEAAPPAPRAARGPPKGQKERERERLERQRQAAARAGGGVGGEGSSSTVQASVAEIQEQADKLLAQASEIGLSVFSKASAFWKEGKEKVVKAYEERSGESGGAVRGDTRGAGATRTGAVGNAGRPKWMQEVVHQSDEEEERVGKGGFKDDHEDDHGHDVPRRHPQQQQQRQRPQQQQQQQQAQINVEHVEVEVDLFSTDAPVSRIAASQPPARSIRQTASVSSSSSHTNRTSASRPVAQAPPAPVPTRSLVTASPSSLAQAQKHKLDGTDKFKLGQHAAAADAYSSSINALPKGHLLLVPLHTNRALARLKTGEYGGAVGDCQRALEGIFGKEVFGSSGSTTDDPALDPLAPKRPAGNTPAPPFLDASVIPPNLITAGKARSNESGWTNPQGVGVDLLDAYVKALRRAAEAFEGRERWADAGVWWGVLSRAGEGAGAAWVDEKSRKEAVSGGVRCRKMIDGSSSSSSGPGAASSPTPSRPAVKPRPKPRPAAVPVSTEPSKALQALQNSNAQAEADDAAKHALKDTVDARIALWKNGKETNIRALLGSLENVLWEGPTGIGGLKMGMADLVSAGQVKKNYMKAIGRVHPDKLNASNSTIEQRMLANAIFGALNEAWIAFQATQK